jgi:hypothetical protein
MNDDINFDNAGCPPIVIYLAQVKADDEDVDIISLTIYR